MEINPELLALAEWRLDQFEKMASQKTAFVPPGAGDPSQGGAPPGGDPSQGGAPPPGGSPPGGGAPPDPTMGMQPPAPGGGGMTPDTIAQIVSQTMQQQMGGGAAGGAGGPGGAGKPAKVDINTVAMDIFQVKKMLQHLFNTMGIPMPPDILDGPNRDPSTGMPMPPNAPGSTSDPATTAAAAQQQGGAAGGGAGGQGAIPPIQPMQPAAGGGGGGGDATKTSSDQALYMGTPYAAGFDPSVINKAAALAALCRRIRA